MLLEFRVENYRSFSEEQSLLLSASRDDSLPGNVIEDVDGRGLALLKSVVIYGANGAGKSNLIRAAALVRHLVLHSATEYQKGQSLPITPFRLNAQLATHPSSFELSFLHKGVRYQYGFKADVNRIHDEWLLAYPEGRAQKWFRREGWSFGPNLKGEKKRIVDFTRDNALYLSTAANLNHPQLSEVFEWFARYFRILSAGDLGFDRRGWLSGSIVTTRRASGDSPFKAKLADLLRHADVGIHGVEVEYRNLVDDDRFNALPDELRSKLEQQTFPQVRTLHRTADRQDVWFDLEDESDGTQKLFDAAGPWLDTIESGATVLVDEVFANLHPLLTRRLLTAFHDAQEDGNAAQAVLTTHDTNLLNPQFVRRDQVWFVEKTRDGSSRLYSLLDYKPRKGEALARGYLAGRYGAIPFLGDFEF